jgi:hypothetical protein
VHNFNFQFQEVKFKIVNYILVNALFVLRTFGFLITNVKIQFQKLTYLFHPSYLRSVFIQYSFPFLSPPLSHFATSFPHVLSCLSLSLLLILHLLPSPSILFSLSSSPHLNLAIMFLPFAVSLPRYSGISSVVHFSYFLLYLFDSFPSFLLVCVFVPFTQLYIHPSSFCS